MEVMLVIGIIAILSSIAIPAFTKYKNRVKYSELAQTMSALFHGQAGLYNREYTHQGMNDPTILQQITPTTGILKSHGHSYAVCPTPAVPGPMGPSLDFSKIGDKPYMPNVSWVGCEHLDFQPTEASYFGYWQVFPSVFSIPGERYKNYAIEDLDGDGQPTILIETTHDRDGELYRSGREFLVSDPDTSP